MTGNYMREYNKNSQFKIIYISVRDRIVYQWIILRKNIGKYYFGHVCSFETNVQKELAYGNGSMHFYYKYLFKDMLRDMKKIYGEDEENWQGKHKFRNAIRIRNLTNQEYEILGVILKRFGYHYNKKKDKLELATKWKKIVQD